jgi:hypothetical protein
MTDKDATRRRLDQLEVDLFGMVREGDHLSPSVVQTGVHRIVTLIAREVHAACLADMNVGGLCPPEDPDVYRMRLAARAYPLPPRRVIREEPDPEGGVFWKWDESATILLYRYNVSGWYRPGAPGQPTFLPTPARVRLWTDLLANPYREVPDNGDE